MKTAAASSNRILLAGAPDAVGALVSLLKGQPWSFCCVHSPSEVLRHLRADPPIDVVLVAPGEQLQAYAELCRTIKLDRRTSMIAVICVLTPACDSHVVDLYAAGVDDCIRSCAPSREVLLRLRKAVRLKHATDTLEEAGAVVTALASAVEGKDHYTAGHVDRVAAYCVQIGRRAGVSPEDLVALRTGGVVHDIGKIGIPDSVLNKPGKLNDEEMAIMRRHPVIGYAILQPLRTFHNVLPIVRWHHERPNGTGYPDGLVGEQIPLLARIAAVADVFDALITDRPYRAALPLPRCQAILYESADRGDLDPHIVQILLEVMRASLPVLAAAGVPAVGA